MALGPEQAPSATWRRVPTFGTGPCPRDCHSAALYLGKMYVFGGWTGEQKLADFYCLDLKTWQWEPLVCTGDVPQGREGHSAVIYGDEFVIFGGQGDGMTCGECYAFSLTNHRWRRLHTSGTLPGERFYHSAVVYNDTMYVFGGCDDEHLYDDVLALHFPTLTWRRMPTTGSAPEGRYCHSAVMYYDSMVIFGGCKDDANFGDLQELCLTTGEWRDVCQRGGLSPSPRFGHSCSVDAAGNFMVLYGGCVESQKYPHIYVFTFDTGVWHLVDCVPPPVAVAGHTAVYDNSRICIFGGASNSDTLGEAYELVLQNSWVSTRHDTGASLYAAISRSINSSDPICEDDDDDDDDDVDCELEEEVITDSDADEEPPQSSPCSISIGSHHSGGRMTSSFTQDSQPSVTQSSSCSPPLPRPPLTQCPATNGTHAPTQGGDMLAIQELRLLLQEYRIEVAEERETWAKRMEELAEECTLPQRQWAAQFTLELRQLRTQVSEMVGLQRILSSQLERVVERLDHISPVNTSSSGQMAERSDGGAQDIAITAKRKRDEEVGV